MNCSLNCQLPLKSGKLKIRTFALNKAICYPMWGLISRSLVISIPDKITLPNHPKG